MKGSCHTPLDWETTKQIVNEGTSESLKLLQRSPENQQSYRIHRKQVPPSIKRLTFLFYQLLAEFASISDSIKIRILKYDHLMVQEDQETRVVFKKKAISSKDHLPKMVFTENEFPYYFERDISHDLLWSEQELSISEIESLISKYKPESEVIWFRNPVELQSIPDLWHIHILSKEKSVQKNPVQRNQNPAQKNSVLSKDILF